jgi:soluble lytic murein transglycosylase-like protein
MTPGWLLKLTYGGRLRLYRPIIERIFKDLGLDPVWGLAIARQETALKAWLINDGPGDAGRGNAWGLFQMTLLTANDRGFVGDPHILLDPEVNTAYAAKHIKWLDGRFHNLRDVASAYNSGRPFHKVPDRMWSATKKMWIPHPTKYTYVPRVLRFAEEFR